MIWFSTANSRNLVVPDFPFFTPVAGLIFETKNREIFLERFFWREITAREQVSRAVILEKFKSSSNVLIWIESCWLPNREGNYCHNCVLFLEIIQTKEHPQISKACFGKEAVKTFFYKCSNSGKMNPLHS